ncbi:MAG: helix-turn-helix domain-containing protein [Methylobacter sp.]
MNIKPIRNDDELKAAFQRLEIIFQAEPDTAEADEMKVLVTLIEAYENKHYAIKPPDPIEAIKFRMEQQNLNNHDLEAYINSSGRVSEVLNVKWRGLIPIICWVLHLWVEFASFENKITQTYPRIP